ncbi:MAG: adenylyl-sulfate kinase [Epsilonproteobacteria bacterium]|nr:MAG: adenylyl-sulfate kinase [Campylobacterota bacterium]RLA65140.1 MAG: adenylyl-sulfate kinase [Campylobacterota bacterium]
MNNLTVFDYTLTRDQIEKKQGHKGCVLWMVGLSGSGKSTLANKIQQVLFQQGIHIKILDGDTVRSGLCGDLGFSESDRAEHLRRIAHTAKLFSEHGVITICSFISPLKINRDQAKKIIGDDFIEVFVDTPLNECESRDPKGLYKKARSGEIPNFTGISAPFEPPINPDLHLNTDLDSMGLLVIKHLDQKKC